MPFDEQHPVHFLNRIAEPDRNLPSVGRLTGIASVEGGLAFERLGMLFFWSQSNT